jgi:hypothetical protein
MARSSPRSRRATPDQLAVAEHHEDWHDPPVGVYVFWRRVELDAVVGLDLSELRKLVPHWFDDDYQQKAEARIVVGAENTGALISKLLRLGADNGPDAEAAWLALDGADGLDDKTYMVGVLTPEKVAKVAEFLSRVDPAAWMQQFRPRLANYCRELGHVASFDDEWADSVVADTNELTELFGLAAAAGEVVIVGVWA